MFLNIKDRYVITTIATDACASGVIWGIPFVFNFHEFFKLYKKKRMLLFFTGCILAARASGFSVFCAQNKIDLRLTIKWCSSFIPGYSVSNKISI